MTNLPKNNTYRNSHLKLSFHGIVDAASRSEEWESRGDNTDRGMVVPLLMQNKVPDGFETDEKLDVQLRPEGVNYMTYF